MDICGMISTAFSESLSQQRISPPQKPINNDYDTDTDETDDTETTDYTDDEEEEEDNGEYLEPSDDDDEYLESSDEDNNDGDNDEYLEPSDDDDDEDDTINETDNDDNDDDDDEYLVEPSKKRNYSKTNNNTNNVSNKRRKLNMDKTLKKYEYRLESDDTIDWDKLNNVYITDYNLTKTLEQNIPHQAQILVKLAKKRGINLLGCVDANKRRNRYIQTLPNKKLRIDEGGDQKVLNIGVKSSNEFSLQSRDKVWR